MAESYLETLRAMIERAAPKLDFDGDIACKHFFGGAAAYANGKIFMSLTDVGLALKLPEPDRKSLMATGGKPLKYFPKAPVKKEYVVVPPHLLTDETALLPWVQSSVDFAGA